MFTGLITSLGKVTKVKKSQDCAIFCVKSDYRDLKIGESISVNGACHTVCKVFDDAFEFVSMNETLSKTNLSSLKAGDIVNLERAMSLSDRFDGHIVTGHIDGCAKLESVKKDGVSSVLGFSYPTNYIVQKGSIAINGVSLTISFVRDNYFEVSLIPHTLENTNLQRLHVADFANIECDILAKYIEKFVRGDKKTSKIDKTFLMENGFNV